MSIFRQRGANAANQGQTNIPPKDVPKHEAHNFAKGHADQKQKNDEAKNGGSKK